MNDSLSPATMSQHNIAEAQQSIADEFALFSDWSERYQYLIDLGKQLTSLPKECQTDQYRVEGCQSMVWLVSDGDAHCMQFMAGSNSLIVSGLLSLLLRVYSNRTAADIIATEPAFIHASGLAKHLSPTRSNGFAMTLAKLKDYARAAVDSE